MNGCYDTPQPKGKLLNLPQKHLDKANPYPKLTADGAKHIIRLNNISDKLKTWRKRTRPLVANMNY